MASAIPFEDFRTSPRAVLEEFLRALGCEAPRSVNAGYVGDVKSSSYRQSDAVILSLVQQIEANDPLTEGHSERVVEYSTLLGRRIGLHGEDLERLRLGGLVHDIGKIAVPGSILFKRGLLTPMEREIVEQHPVVGETICAHREAFRSVLPIIRHHHERLDGTGYPDGLRGEEIPLMARILQVADIYDALTSNRPYRRALSPEEALDELSREAELGWVDLSLVKQFRELIYETCGCLSRDRSTLVDYTH